jgi:hypothetical protein
MRAALHDSLRSAGENAGIPPDQFPEPRDTGDGALLLFPATVSKARVAGRWVEEVRQALRRHNSILRDPIRVRVGIHAGEVHLDEFGVSGADVNIACRLANCEPARALLRSAAEACLVVAVSDAVFQSVVQHGGDHLDPDSYRRDVLDSHEYRGPMWLAVPGQVPPASSRTDPADPVDPVEPSPREAAGHRLSGTGVIMDHSRARNVVVRGGGREPDDG